MLVKKKVTLLSAKNNIIKKTKGRPRKIKSGPSQTVKAAVKRKILIK
jgi:hypothetical protein